MTKLCEKCRKERTFECRNPKECIENDFSRFAPARKWEKCEECGAKLLVARTDVSFGDDLHFVYLTCPSPDCPLKAKLGYNYERIDKK